MGAPYSHRKACVQGEFRTDSPVVGEVSIVDGLTKVFVGVPEGDGTGVGNAKEEIGEAGTRSRAGESKRAAGILLPKRVELLAAEIASELEVVSAAIPQHRRGDAARLVTIEGALRIGEGGDTAREHERGRTPVDCVLIVACNASESRDVLAVPKIRHDVA